MLRSTRPTPETPSPNQESVWDYPRPPRLEPTTRRLIVKCCGVTLADTTRGYRVLETSHPPVYYFPPDNVSQEYLRAVSQNSFCEWKGSARYYDVVVGERVVEHAVWDYPTPVPEFAAIRDYFAFYPQKMDACYVDGEQARPQPGGFYGGWITSDLAGPFKGVPGSMGW